MITLFASAFLLGLLFNAAPGAVFAETIRQGVRGGFRPALAVQIGSLVGDALWAILGLAGVGVILHQQRLRGPVGIASVAYLLWLAWDSWHSADVAVAVSSGNGELQPALRAGVMLSVTNPQNVGYWAAMGSALGAMGVRADALAYSVFFVAFMTSSVLWAFCCAALVDGVFRRLGSRWARTMYRLCAAAFVLLALASARETLVALA